MSCALCQRVELTKEDAYPFLIHEFTHSYLYLGEHQFYPGYSILVSKNHYREMTDLPLNIQNVFFQEMMKSHQAIQDAFKPQKMNMCSLGNVVDHIHWHFFPRYKEDKDFKNPPWLQMNQFESAKITHEMAAEVIEKIRRHLSE